MRSVNSIRRGVTNRTCSSLESLWGRIYGSLCIESNDKPYLFTLSADMPFRPYDFNGKLILLRINYNIPKVLSCCKVLCIMSSVSQNTYYAQLH